MRKCPAVLFLLLCLIPLSASAKTKNLAFLANVGTDVSLGLGFGAGLRVYYPSGGGGYVEAGPDFYFHNSEETYDEGLHTYTEQTSLNILAVRANYLVPLGGDNLFILGVGVANVSQEWTISSPTDSSLGQLSPGGGSQETYDGGAFGTILNLGVHMPLSRTNFVRIETPIIMFEGYYGAVFAPTMTMSFGILL